MKKYIILIGFILVGQIVLAQQRIQLKSINVATKLNVVDTVNMRLRPIAGSNVTISGTYPNLTFSSTGGGGGSTDTSSLSNRINTKISISDSAAMLSGYQTAINQRLKISDTAAMLSGYGTAINQRLKITDTANIRVRPIAGTNTTITGTYPNLTFNATATPIDTSSLSNRINTKLAISDTSGMLSSYQTAINSKLTPTGSAASLTNFPTFNQSTTGNAANLTGLTTTVATLNNVSGVNTGDQTLPTLSSLGAVASNTAITGATNTKITYDAKGLVTAGSAATTADIAASTNKNYVTDAQQTVIGNTSGTNTGDNATNTQYSGLGSVINTKYDSLSVNFDSSKYTFWSNNIKVDSISSLTKNLYGLGRISLTDSSNGNGYIKLDTTGLGNATHTGDATGSTALTLATVNSNVGSFTSANITVNAKGLITAASNGSGGGGVSGTTNYIPKFATSTTLGNSNIFDDGTNVGIGTTTPLLSAVNRKVVDISGTNESILVLSTGSAYKGYLYNDGTDISLLSDGQLLQQATSNIILQTGGTTKLSINSTGVTTLSNLAGSGSRMVVANATGVLSTQTIPTGDMILASPQTNTGVKTFNAGSLVIGAGSATQPVENFTSTGAVLMTTPLAGDGEVDANGIRYYSPSDNARGVVVAQQFMTLTAPYTLTSQTAAQKIFNVPTNGAFNAKAATSYFFECFYSLSSMSATSGNFGFALGGTATLTSINWSSTAIKQSTQTATGTALLTRNVTAANLGVVASSVQTGGYATIRGIVRVNAAGTLIPSVSLGIAAAAIVGRDAYFRIYPIGDNNVTNIGNFQ